MKRGLIDPAIEKLSEKAGNKYILCNVISKRAKEILKEKKDPSYNIKDNMEIKEISQAADELEEGKLEIENPTKVNSENIDEE